MATIRKRGPYAYDAQVRKKGFPHLHKSFTTREEAELWAAETELSMRRGAWQSTREADETTVREAFDRYLIEITPLKKGAKRERDRIKQLQASELGQRFLSSLRGMDLAKWRDERLKSVGANSVRLELAAVSHLYTICRKEWGMEYLVNPVQSVRAPSPPGGRERRLEWGEEDRLMVELTGELRAIVIFAIETAMRRGEIMAMRWEWIRRPVVRIPESKNGAARSVPLSSRALAVLDSLPRRIDGMIFSLYIDDVTREFQYACRRAGIDGMRFHDLRHEATSRLFERGLSLMEVASITGHKSLAMLNRYTHLNAHSLASKLG